MDPGFLQTLKYQGKDPIPAILTHLDEIDKLSESVATTRSKRRKLSILLFVLILPVSFVLAMLGSPGAGVVIAIALLGGGIGTLIWSSKCPSKLINNRYRGA